MLGLIISYVLSMSQLKIANVEMKKHHYRALNYKMNFEKFFKSPGAVARPFPQPKNL